MGPKIQRVRLNNFRASWSILTGLFSVDAPRIRGVKMTSGLVGLFSWNFFSRRAARQWWSNGFKFWKARSTIFTDLDVRLQYLYGTFSVDVPRGRGDKMDTIFTMPAPKNLWQQKNRPKFLRDFSQLSTTTPVLEGKKFVYFGPQTTEFIPLINLHPSGLFSGDYISALRGCCALKFLHVQRFTKAC